MDVGCMSLPGWQQWCHRSLHHSDLSRRPSPHKWQQHARHVKLAAVPRRNGRCTAAAAASDAAAVQVPATKSALRGLKKDELAAALRAMQLSDAGLKPELVSRLHEALQRQAASASPDEAAAPDRAESAEARRYAAAAEASPFADAANTVPTITSGSTVEPSEAISGLQEPDLAALAAAAATPDPPSAVAAVAAEAPERREAKPAASPAAPAAAPQAQQRRQQQQLPECDVPTGLAVQWLGTSSGAPTAQRNVSSILLLQRRRVLMVDCGEGTINQLAAGGIDPVLVQGVFVTHMHGDHVFGMPGLVRGISRRIQELSISDPSTFHIHGPPGVQELLRAALPATMSQLAMPVCITEYTTDPAAAALPTEVAPGIFCATQPPDVAPPPQLAGLLRKWMDADLPTLKRLGSDGPSNPLAQLSWRLNVGPDITVTAAPLAHRLPCWGYVFQEPAIMLPNPMGSAEPIRAEGAQPQMVQPGRKVVLLGDTCNSSAMLGPGFGADVLSHECTFSNEEEDKAAVAMHSTAAMAGAFAARLRARRLVLTHFSGRYKTSGAARIAGAVEETNRNTQAYLAHQARVAMGVPPSSRQIGVAKDFLKLDVPPRRPHPAAQGPGQQQQPQHRHQVQQQQQHQQGQHARQQGTQQGQRAVGQQAGRQQTGAMPRNGTPMIGTARQSSGPTEPTTPASTERQMVQIR